MSRDSTREYIEKVNSSSKLESEDTKIFVFPPSTALQNGLGRVSIGAQNAYYVENGAFTGEIGLEQLNEFGIESILIGHSERRHILNETQDEIVHKFNYFKEHGFTVIYCIGEPIDVRESGRETLIEYLESQLNGIDMEYKNLIIAYEPVWAIGTGARASVDEIELMLGYLKNSYSTPLLYGGSVKVDNIEEILEISSCDGVLVGSASLSADDFITMIKTKEKKSDNEG